MTSTPTPSTLASRLPGFRRFILRLLAATLVPLGAIFIVYVWMDPFHVVRNYEDHYTCSLRGENPPMEYNKGMVTMQHFERRTLGKPRSEWPNAYIFGSSMSIPYRTDHWRDIATRGDSAARADFRPIHFDSSSESFHSLRLKVEWLLSQGVELRHALIVLAPVSFQWRVHNEATPFINHWKIDPEVSHLKWHLTFLRGFCDREFRRAYMARILLGRPARVAMVRLEPTRLHIDALTNTEWSLDREEMVRTSPELYSEMMDYYFPEAPEMQVYPPFATEETRREVFRIASLMREAGTDVHVVIHPWRDKHVMSTSDLQVLREAFGPERVHDYGRSMLQMTAIDTLYLDCGHIRWPLATEVMRRAYSGEP